MNKILIAVFCVVIAASLIISGIAYFAEPEPVEKEVSVRLTVVETADQTEVSRPGGFPDPEQDWVKLPEGTNLAEGKAVSSGEFTEVYDAVNVVDGDTNTYWESKGLPAELTIDLAGTYNVQTVGVRLNPAPIWEARTQNFEILVSGDGNNFTVVAPDARHEFNPDSGNIVRVDFDPVAARYVRLVFTAKSSGRSNGGQAAEIVIYE